MIDERRYLVAGQRNPFFRSACWAAPFLVLGALLVPGCGGLRPRSTDTPGLRAEIAALHAQAFGCHFDQIEFFPPIGVREGLGPEYRVWPCSPAESGWTYYICDTPQGGCHMRRDQAEALATTRAAAERTERARADEAQRLAERQAQEAERQRRRIERIEEHRAQADREAEDARAREAEAQAQAVADPEGAARTSIEAGRFDEAETRIEALSHVAGRQAAVRALRAELRAARVAMAAEQVRLTSAMAGCWTDSNTSPYAHCYRADGAYLSIVGARTFPGTWRFVDGLTYETQQFDPDTGTTVTQRYEVVNLEAEAQPPLLTLRSIEYGTSAIWYRTER